MTVVEHPGQTVFLDLDFDLDVLDVAKQIKMRTRDADMTGVAADFINAVKPVAHPRAAYRPLKVDFLDESSFKIGGTTFDSRVLGNLLEKDSFIFPYLVTIGPELDSLALSQNDMLGRFHLDTVKTMVLGAAGRSFEEHLKNKYPGRRLTHINPGELDDWPITQQRPLFSLFDGVVEKLGVRLTEGCMIKPVKSRAGIYFANDDGFETCRLCKQFRCPGRRAGFDAAVLARMTA
jgi:hypothetical protein